LRFPRYYRNIFFGITLFQPDREGPLLILQAYPPQQEQEQLSHKKAQLTKKNISLSEQRFIIVLFTALRDIFIFKCIFGPTQLILRQVLYKLFLGYSGGVESVWQNKIKLQFRQTIDIL